MTLVDRIISLQLSDSDDNDADDEFLYMKVTDLVEKDDNDDLEDIMQIEMMNQDVVKSTDKIKTKQKQQQNKINESSDKDKTTTDVNQHHEIMKEFKISIECTNGQSNYLIKNELTRQQIKDNRVKTANAMGVIKDDEIFIDFIYKFLLYGTYDVDDSQFEMIGTAADDGEGYDLIIVKKSGEFAIKLFTIQLRESNELVVDLFQWFHLLSLQSVKLFKRMNYLFKLNKINEFKITKLINDNEEVLKNYDLIRESTEKFKLLLNLKKKKILELSNSSDQEEEDVFLDLNGDRKEIDRYDVINKSTIDITDLGHDGDDYESNVNPVQEKKRKRTIKTKTKVVPKKLKVEKDQGDIKIKKEEQPSEVILKEEQDTQEDLPLNEEDDVPIKDEQDTQEDVPINEVEEEEEEEEDEHTDYSTDDE